MVGANATLPGDPDNGKETVLDGFDQSLESLKTTMRMAVSYATHQGDDYGTGCREDTIAITMFLSEPRPVPIPVKVLQHGTSLSTRQVPLCKDLEGCADRTDSTPFILGKKCSGKIPWRGHIPRVNDGGTRPGRQLIT